MKETSFLSRQTDENLNFYQFPLLKDLSKSAFQNLLSICKICTFYSGEMLTVQDDFDYRVYFLISGKVSIVRDKEQIALLNQVGDLFCEMVLIEETERSASVIALVETQCLCLDAILLQEMAPHIKDQILPVFYKGIAKTLARRLRVMNEEAILLKKELRADL